MKNKIWCVVFVLLPLLLNAQERKMIYGYVNSEDGSILTGATISRLGTNEGVIADTAGYFSLLAEPDDTLQFSFVGYQNQNLILDRDMELPLRIRLDKKIDIDGQIITIRGVRSPIESQSSTPVMTLGTADLRRDDGISIRPALNRVPGVLMHSGALNTNRITIRGIGNRSPFATAKIRAYFNDIPLTNGVGETTLEDIDLSLIDKVTIWKGPAASAYGAGLGGMIHLQSDQALNQEGIGANLESTYGNYDTRRIAAGIGFGPKEVSNEASWNARLQYHNMHSDGYRDNNEYDRQGATFLGIKRGQVGNTTLLVNFVDLKAFIPSSINRDDYLTEPQKAAFTWAQVKGFEDSQKLLVGLSHESNIAIKGKKILQNTTSLFGTWYNNYESRPFNILTEDNQALGGRTRFVIKPGKGDVLTLQAGAEVFVENYDWQTYRTDGGQQDTLRSDNSEIRSYSNLFAEATIKLGDYFQIEAGFNFNQSQYDLTDKFLRDNNDLSGDYSFAAIFSPRLGLRYQLPASISIFSNISHGFSPPTLEETLTPDGNINPEIQPEKGWNFELGFRRNSPYYHKFNFELTTFSMSIQDLLVARRTALDQYVGINAGKTVHQGIEAYIQYALSDPVSIFVNYTYSNYRFKDFVDEEDDYSGNKLTGTPPHLFNAGFDFNPYDEGFYGNITFSFVDAMPIRDDNSISSEAYQIMNLKLGYKKSVLLSGKRPLVLNGFIGVNNLWDEKYASMLLVNAGSFGGAAPRYYYPGLPRNFYVGLRFSL